MSLKFYYSFGDHAFSPIWDTYPIADFALIRRKVKYAACSDLQTDSSTLVWGGQPAEGPTLGSLAYLNNSSASDSSHGLGIRRSV